MTRDRRPPRLTDWLLRQAVPPGVRGDTILGDLREEFAARQAAGLPARSWYRRHALGFAVRYALSRLKRPTRPHVDDRILSETPPMLVDTVLQDLRYACRSLLKTPSFAFVLLATLALGIGASTAIFSMVNGIVLRPLPFPDSDRLVFAAETAPQSGDRMSIAWPNYVDWRHRSHSFADLAGAQQSSATITGVDQPQRLDARRVTTNFFAVVGVRPQIGRAFAERDFAADAEPTAIISDKLWKTQFASDPNILARTVSLDTRTHTIIGVLPPGFRYFRADDVYLRLTVEPNTGMLDRGNHQGIYALGRLKDGVTVETAAAEVKGIAAQLAREYPDTNSGNGALAMPLSQVVVSNIRLTLLVLLGAVLFLLLIACVNVANLLVARGASRQHELAIRAALGGGRLRLVRQLLVESSVVSLAGGAFGMALAWGLLRVLVAMAPVGTPRIDEVQLDGTAMLFALGASIGCGVIFGAFPAIQASGARGQHALVRAHGSVGAAAHSHRLRRTLMVVEVALALVLLAGAGLMARTLQALTRVDPGFSPENIIATRFSLAGQRWDEPGPRRVFYSQVEERVKAIPGVIDAALTNSLPIDGSNWNSVFIAGDKPVPPRAELPSSAFTPVSARFFATMGIRLVRGRLFDATDHDTSPRVTVINETLARRIWPDQDPIGRRLKQGWPESKTPWREVVGIVADVKLNGVAMDTPMQAYLPIAHEPSRVLTMVVRAAGDPKPLLPSIERAVHEIDKDLALYNVTTMPELLDLAVARERVSMFILMVFAAVALVLASVGLYGVVAHGVTERTHEIGVRMALGANQRDVRRLFLRQGLVTSAAGVAIGLAGAIGLSRWMEKLLFGVKPTDPVTLTVVVSALLLVSLAACYVPARRATRVDPTVALRME